MAQPPPRRAAGTAPRSRRTRRMRWRKGIGGRGIFLEHKGLRGVRARGITVGVAVVLLSERIGANSAVECTLLRVSSSSTIINEL